LVELKFLTKKYWVGFLVLTVYPYGAFPSHLKCFTCHLKKTIMETGNTNNLSLLR